MVEVGNCCVNNFLGLKEGNRIFGSISRIKRDGNCSMSLEALQYLLDKQAIRKYEFDFYNNTFRKRNLSAAQLKLRAKINLNLLQITNYEKHSLIYKINEILGWAEHNPYFDTSFVESVRKRCEEKGDLSDKQKVAFENIIKIFGIRRKGAVIA